MDSWAKDEDLVRACERYRICCNNEHPKMFRYTSYEGILQEGPQCGLIALAMCCKLGPEGIDRLVATAKCVKFTLNGEMFSVKDMCILAELFTEKKCELYSGDLFNKDIIEFLLNGGVMLVPYDSDANHSPCTKNGHKAHWALISGIIITVTDDIYVFARQGKSKHLAIWALKALSESNSQLREFSPQRRDSNLTYILPEGGLVGPDGLCNKCVLIYNK